MAGRGRGIVHSKISTLRRKKIPLGTRSRNLPLIQKRLRKEVKVVTKKQVIKKKHVKPPDTNAECKPSVATKQEPETVKIKQEPKTNSRSALPIPLKDDEPLDDDIDAIIPITKRGPGRPRGSSSNKSFRGRRNSSLPKELDLTANSSPAELLLPPKSPNIGRRKSKANWDIASVQSEPVGVGDDPYVFDDSFPILPKSSISLKMRHSLPRIKSTASDICNGVRGRSRGRGLGGYYSTRSDSSGTMLRNGKRRKPKESGILDGLDLHMPKRRKRLTSEKSQIKDEDYDDEFEPKNHYFIKKENVSSVKRESYNSTKKQRDIYIKKEQGNSVKKERDNISKTDDISVKEENGNLITEENESSKCKENDSENSSIEDKNGNISEKLNISEKVDISDVTNTPEKVDISEISSTSKEISNTSKEIDISEVTETSEQADISEVVIDASEQVDISEKTGAFEKVDTPGKDEIFEKNNTPGKGEFSEKVNTSEDDCIADNINTLDKVDVSDKVNVLDKVDISEKVLLPENIDISEKIDIYEFTEDGLDNEQNNAPELMKRLKQIEAKGNDNNLGKSISNKIAELIKKSSNKFTPPTTPKKNDECESDSKEDVPPKKFTDSNSNVCSDVVLDKSLRTCSDETKLNIPKKLFSENCETSTKPTKRTPIYEPKFSKSSLLDKIIDYHTNCDKGEKSISPSMIDVNTPKSLSLNFSEVRAAISKKIKDEQQRFTVTPEETTSERSELRSLLLSGKSIKRSPAYEKCSCSHSKNETGKPFNMPTDIVPVKKHINLPVTNSDKSFTSSGLQLNEPKSVESLNRSIVDFLPDKQCILIAINASGEATSEITFLDNIKKCVTECLTTVEKRRASVELRSPEMISSDGDNSNSAFGLPTPNITTSAEENLVKSMPAPNIVTSAVDKSMPTPNITTSAIDNLVKSMPDPNFITSAVDNLVKSMPDPNVTTNAVVAKPISETVSKLNNCNPENTQEADKLSDNTSVDECGRNICYNFSGLDNSTNTNQTKDNLVCNTTKDLNLTETVYKAHNEVLSPEKEKPVEAEQQKLSNGTNPENNMKIRGSEDGTPANNHADNSLNISYSAGLVKSGINSQPVLQEDSISIDNSKAESSVINISGASPIKTFVCTPLSEKYENKPVDKNTKYLSAENNNGTISTVQESKSTSPFKESKSTSPFKESKSASPSKESKSTLPSTVNASSDESANKNPELESFKNLISPCTFENPTVLLQNFATNDFTSENVTLPKDQKTSELPFTQISNHSVPDNVLVNGNSKKSACDISDLDKSFDCLKSTAVNNKDFEPSSNSQESMKSNVSFLPENDTSFKMNHSEPDESKNQTVSPLSNEQNSSQELVDSDATLVASVDVTGVKLSDAGPYLEMSPKSEIVDVTRLTSVTIGESPDKFIDTMPEKRPSAVARRGRRRRRRYDWLRKPKNGTQEKTSPNVTDDSSCFSVETEDSHSTFESRRGLKQEEIEALLNSSFSSLAASPTKNKSSSDTEMIVENLSNIDSESIYNKQITNVELTNVELDISEQIANSYTVDKDSGENVLDDEEVEFRKLLNPSSEPFISLESQNRISQNKTDSLDNSKKLDMSEFKKFTDLLGKSMTDEIDIIPINGHDEIRHNDDETVRNLLQSAHTDSLLIGKDNSEISKNGPIPSQLDRVLSKNESSSQDLQNHNKTVSINIADDLIDSNSEISETDEQIKNFIEQILQHENMPPIDVIQKCAENPIHINGDNLADSKLKVIITTPEGNDQQEINVNSSQDEVRSSSQDEVSCAENTEPKTDAETKDEMISTDFSIKPVIIDDTLKESGDTAKESEDAAKESENISNGKIQTCPEEEAEKETILSALGLQSLKEAKARAASNDRRKHESYTGTLKTVIKVQRSPDKRSRGSRGPKGKKVENSDGDDALCEENLSGEEAAERVEYKICAENVPVVEPDMNSIVDYYRKHPKGYRSLVGVNSNGLALEKEKAENAVLDLKEDMKPSAKPATANLVIPEKSSSFSIHPGRLCSDVCSYCFGKFGSLDTPCHVAQLKNPSRQQKILEIETHLTADSCLCDACYRHVDRKANCPSYKPNKKRHHRSELMQTKVSCCVQGCSQTAKHTIRRKWLIKLKRSIAKKVPIDMEKMPPHLPFPLCPKHYSWVDYYMVCGVCKRRLTRNHMYPAGPDIDKLNTVLTSDGIPVRLTDKVFLCKLCRYFCNLRLKNKDPTQLTGNHRAFFQDYKKRILHYNDIEVMDEKEAAEPIEMPSKGKRKRPKSKDEQSETVTTEQKVTEDVKAETESSGNTETSQVGESETSEIGNKSESSETGSTNGTNVQNKSSKSATRLRIGPDGVRHLGTEELSLHASFEFVQRSESEGPPKTGEWEKLHATIQFDKETKRLFQELHRPYGNNSSFFRHLVLLEKYWRSGDLVLSPNASSRSANYINSVQNRINSFEGRPTPTPSPLPSIPSGLIISPSPPVLPNVSVIDLPLRRRASISALTSTATSSSSASTFTAVPLLSAPGTSNSGVTCTPIFSPMLSNPVVSSIPSSSVITPKLPNLLHVSAGGKSFSIVPNMNQIKQLQALQRHQIEKQRRLLQQQQQHKHLMRQKHLQQQQKQQQQQQQKQQQQQDAEQASSSFVPLICDVRSLAEDQGSKVWSPSPSPGPLINPLLGSTGRPRKHPKVNVTILPKPAGPRLPGPQFRPGLKPQTVMTPTGIVLSKNEFNGNSDSGIS